MAVSGTAAHTDQQWCMCWRKSLELNASSNVLSWQHWCVTGQPLADRQTKKKLIRCIKPTVHIFHMLQYRMNTMITMIYVRSYWGASYARCRCELNLPPVTALQCWVCVWLTMTQTRSFHLSDGLLDILEAVKIERFMRDRVRLWHSVTPNCMSAVNKI